MIHEPTLRALSVVALVATVLACGSPMAPTSPTTGDDTAYTASEQAPTAQPSAPEPAAPPRTPYTPPAPASSPRPAAQAPQSAPPAARPAAQPSASPRPPQPVTMVIPSGTQLDVEFLDSVSSAESQPGDPVRVRVMTDIRQDGVAVVPAGSVVVGSVTEAVPLKKIGGKARVGVEFTKLELTSGRTASIHTSFA